VLPTSRGCAISRLRSGRCFTTWQARRSPEIDRAFHWGLDVLERWLGEQWPQTCYEAGGLPPELGGSSWSLHALAMLIDLAGSLELIGRGSGMGKVRRALRANPNWETIASTRCMLRLAMAGLRADLRPEPEHGQPPMDLMLVGHRVKLGLEIKTLRRTDLTIEIDRWLDDLTLRLLVAISTQDVLIIGDAREALGDKQTEALARRIVDAADLVRAGFEAPAILAGANRFEVRRPRPDEKPGSRIAMPAEDLWRRILARIASAAEQVTKSGARWLVIESLDNLWELTPWSRESAAIRASSLAERARELLARETHLDGVLFTFTDGAAMTDPGSTDEESMPDPGAMFIRRRLDYVRSRQTIVVALTDGGVQALPVWNSLFKSEPRFAEWALPRLGLSPPPQLVG
jgi:hypothetical protein